MKTKKIATSVAAVAAAATVLVGGTFAWQSISQTALNEGSDVINPGGRLHNDMWYVSAEENNNDIYVENFGDEAIFARVRLSEYMEIVLNKGTDGEIEKQIIGSKTEKTDENGTPVYEEDGITPVYDYTYRPFTGYDDTGVVTAGIETDADGNEVNTYWTWFTGGETVYMPTFNMNKDSLMADLNGIYEDGNVGTISNRVPVDDPEHQYSDWTEWAEGQTKKANEIWDYDSNTEDELEGTDLSVLIDPEQTSAENYTSENVALVYETHIAQPTQNAQLISMSAWLSEFDDGAGGYDASLYDPTVHGYYWVYDDSEGGDGWVYWSAPISAGDATGLLLDGTVLNQVMDDTWYYAIEAVGQFCTLDDTGSVEDSTGFYDLEEGSAPTENALTLLSIIGVTDTTPGEDDEEEPGSKYNMYVYASKAANEDIMGSDMYIEPEVAYKLIACVDYDPVALGYEEEGYDVTFSISATNAAGEDVTLTEGVDYTLVNDEIEGVAIAEDPMVTGYTEYHATATLTILNEELLGGFVTIYASAPNSGEDSSSFVVQYDYIDLNVALFDTDGNEVTSGPIKAKTTYDVVVTAETENYGTLTLYDSREGGNPVASNIDMTVGAEGLLHVYDPFGESAINEDGRLETLERPGMEGDVSHAMHVSATVYDLKVYEDGTKGNLVYRTYAYGESLDYTLEGYAPMQIVTGADPENLSVIDGWSGVELDTREIYDVDIAESDVAYSVSGANDNTTAVVTTDGSSQLVLGPNETSTSITVTAKAEGYADTTLTFTVTYPTILTLQVVDEPAEVEKGKNYTLYVDGYDGDAANLTWSVDSSYSSVVATTESEYAMAATLDVSASETAGELIVTVRDDVGNAYGSITLPIHYDLVVDYTPDEGNAVWIQDSKYYTMYFTAALNEVGLKDIRYLKGTVYEEDGAEPLYYANENIGFVYGEATNSFFFKIPMDSYTLTDGATYELRVEYINGDNTYAGKSLYYTYTASGN